MAKSANHNMMTSLSWGGVLAPHSPRLRTFMVCDMEVPSGAQGQSSGWGSLLGTKSSKA